MYISQRILTIFFLLVSLIATAQKRENVYYLKNSGELSVPAEKADFVRIISEPDSGSKWFNVKEYYPNDQLKFTGKCANADSGSLILQGECISYYSTGIKQQTAKYEYGNLINELYDYYPNGKPYSILRYYPVGPDFLTITQPDVIACYDSIGKALVTNGNGHYINYANDFKNIIEEGDLKSNKKDGVWKGGSTDITSKFSYISNYDNGKFISIKIMDDGGNKFNSSETAIKPTFNGGETAIKKLISHNVKYPATAKTDRVEGKVFIEFTVNNDGTLNNFKILRDPGDGLGDEALRVVKKYSKWIPGIKFGQPISMPVTFFVNFSLYDFRIDANQ